MNTNQTGERIDTGDDVTGSDGNKLGSVSYLVVRPPEMTVTDIVVSTGAVLGRDVVVPMDKVEGVTNKQVNLSIDKDQLAKLPDYVDVRYQVPPSSWIPPAGFYYPPTSVLWPGDYYNPPTSVTVNAPAGTIGLHQGMDVESSDGHKVGSIDGFDVNPRDDDVTAVIIKHGFIFTHDTRVPIEFVSKIDNGKVCLNLTKDEVQQRFEGKGDDELRGR